jgi:hypothetical protein
MEPIAERRPPHERINFNLRPAKHIERRMIAEVLSRITRYENPSRFAYIGMGSFYFADFVVMHKALGIDEMYSFELDSDDRDRFTFNAPFGCIKVIFGSTHDKLPTLDVFGKRPVIAWLDYYGYLDDAKIGDIETVAMKCRPGSALIVTVNGANPAMDSKRLALFKARLSARNRPASFSVRSFASNATFAETCRAAAWMRIQSTLARRNAMLNTISARQIFNFRYADGAQMATFGWLFLSTSQNDALEKDPKLLNSFPVADSDKAIDIEAPSLTFKEIGHLRRLLPDQEGVSTYLSNAKPVAQDAAKQFARLYRHFPSFAHVEE